MKALATQRQFVWGALASALGFAVTAVAFYPGFMSADSLAQYESSKTLTFTDWHPPVMGWVWSLFNALSDGPQGMLLWQLVLLWTALFLWYSHLIPNSRGAWALLAVGLLPWVLNFAGVIWKDVGMAFALALAMALGSSTTGFVTVSMSISMLFYALSLRYNALFALPPLLIFLWSRWRPDAKAWQAVAASIATLAAMLVATNAMNYRVLKAEKTSPSSYMMVDDLFHLSLREGRSLIPGISMSDIQHCAGRIIGQNRLVGRSFCLAEGRSFSKRNPLNTPELSQIWLDAVTSHPLRYLQFRMAAFVYLLRTAPDPPYYIWHPGIDANTFGLAHTDNALTRVVHWWVHASSKLAPMLFKPFIWVILGMTVLTASVVRVRTKNSNAALALSSSALLYILGYLPATPMADFRYVYWSVLAISLAAVLVLVEPRTRPATPWPLRPWFLSLPISLCLVLVALYMSAQNIFDLKIDRLLWSQLGDRGVPVIGVPRPMGFAPVSDGLYRVTGPDPHLIYDLGTQGVASKDVDYIALDFRCEGRRTDPAIQLFWWSDNQPAAREERSTTFNPVQGVNVISTRSLRGWGDIDRLAHLRIDLDPNDACAFVRIGEVRWVPRAP
jgi:hypothetical protein